MSTFFPSFSPLLAFTACSSDSPARLRWVGEQAHAVEFSPDPEQLELLPRMVSPFLEAGLSVRFHTRYFQYELGHADQDQARRALDVHMRTLSAMAGLSESVVTVHTGLDPNQPVQFSRIVENLSRLVEFAEKLGITVCLENLRKGHSSEPRRILEWATASGSMITLDIGHALGAACVVEGRRTPEDFVELFSSRLFGVHIYGKEDEHGHHPIRPDRDMAVFDSIINKLLATQCTWWTVELQGMREAMSTRTMLEKALHERKGKNAAGWSANGSRENINRGEERSCTTSA